MTLRIDHLFRHPEHIRLVAGWIYHEFWRDKPGYSIEVFEGLLRRASDPARIPLSLLALDDEEPAGTVNLIQSDSPSRPHLHPWLAALFVAPAHRGRGIGEALCRALVAEARRLGVTDLYLCTDIPAFYSALGAEPYEPLTGSLCIMRFRLGPSSPAGQPSSKS